MLFKSIELCNFGRYADKNFFDTTVTADRNVILVQANNDRGKTTLFQAIKFALYGEDELHTGSASNWINFQRASESDGETYVEIKFNHKNNEYRLKRLVKFRRTERGKEIAMIGNPTIDIFENDNPYMIQDSVYMKQEWIDTILPKDASQFFFFDGEEIQKYIQHESAHVKEAIEKVLGIKELLNAKEDLQQILLRFESERNKNFIKHTKDQRSQLKLKKIQDDLENLELMISSERRSYKGAEATKNRLDKEQKKFTEIKGIVDDRNDADRSLNKLKQVLKENQKSLAEANKHAGLVLISPLLDIIHGTEEDPPTVDRWQSNVVKYIIKENLDKCVCNRPIDQHVRNIFESKMLDIKPSKTSILKKSVTYMLVEYSPGTKWMALQNSLNEVANTLQTIDKQESALGFLNKQIRDSDIAGSLKDLQDKYDEAVKDMGKFEKNIERYEKEKSRLENDKTNMETKINSSVADEQLTLASSRRDTCKKVIDCISQCIERFYKTRKPDLENHISAIFSSLTNNPDMYRGLKINRDFSMNVIRQDGTELPTYKYSPSPGASQIVATSMIGGLNKFAVRDAPIVIDTPMGRLDPVHRENLINYYSKMGKQIIILYQPSELKSNDIQIINYNIASEWKIDSRPDHPDLSSLHREKIYYE